MSDKTLTLDQFRTLRKDNWWIEPLMVVLVLGGFAVYATWAALQNALLLCAALSVAVLLAVHLGELRARNSCRWWAPGGICRRHF